MSYIRVVRHGIFVLPSFSSGFRAAAAAAAQRFENCPGGDTNMHARTSRKALSPIAIAVVAALAAAPAARAQDAGTGAGGLEEIIVTAQKREQKLQEVPIAVSVVTTD